MIKYILVCNCGNGVSLGLTEREQREHDAEKLNKNTAIFANLFEHFHAQHGIVSKYFSDEPMPDFHLDAEAAPDKEETNAS